MIDKQAMDQNEAVRQYRVNDKRDENYKRDYDKIMLQIEDVEVNCDEIREIIERTTNKLSQTIEDKSQRIMTSAENSEAHLNLQIEKANREIERLKYELTEQLETK